MQGINIDFDVNALAEKFGQAANVAMEKIGTNGTAVIGYAVRGKFAEGVAGIMIALFLLGLWAFVLRWMTMYVRKNKLIGSDLEGYYVFGGLGSFLVLAISIPMLYGGIINVIAPEYALIKDVIFMVQSKLN